MDSDAETGQTAERTEEFNRRYAIGADPALRRAEERVMGTDYGASSYTTRAQADQLAELLELSAGSLLLDVGSGAGWPGLYLARRTGCRAVLSDIPLEGLRQAQARRAVDATRAWITSASGTKLPFRASTFDAVTCSDVFC